MKNETIQWKPVMPQEAQPKVDKEKKGELFWDARAFSVILNKIKAEMSNSKNTEKMETAYKNLIKVLDAKITFADRDQEDSREEFLFPPLEAPKDEKEWQKYFFEQAALIKVAKIAESSANEMEKPDKDGKINTGNENLEQIMALRRAAEQFEKRIEEIVGILSEKRKTA